MQSKKTKDHNTLRASCTANKANDQRAGFQPPRRHTNHAATAIVKYKTLQTGPNNQSGGVHVGRAIC
jgi:hypothetical protein